MTRDLDTLRGIIAARGLRDGKHADFGVLADVEQPGRIRVGDDGRRTARLTAAASTVAVDQLNRRGVAAGRR